MYFIFQTQCIRLYPIPKTKKASRSSLSNKAHDRNSLAKSKKHQHSFFQTSKGKPIAYPYLASIIILMDMFSFFFQFLICVYSPSLS